MSKIIRGFVVVVLMAVLFGLTSSAIPAYAVSLPFVEHFNNTSSWGTIPYTIGGVSAPAPTVDSSQNAPDSPGGSLRFTFPVGWPPGYEPGKAWCSVPQVEELWTEYWFKYSDGFQFQPVTNKHVYWVLGSSEKEGDFTLMTDGSRKMWMGPQPKGGTSTAFYANKSYNPTIETGVWYKATVHIKLNTSTSPYNGVFQLWINDTQVMDHNNVNYRTNTYINSKIGTLELVPVWGGSGGSNKAKIDYFWLDAIRLQTTSFDINSGGGGGVTSNPPPMAPTGLNITN